MILSAARKSIRPWRHGRSRLSRRSSPPKAASVDVIAALRIRVAEPHEVELGEPDQRSQRRDAVRGFSASIRSELVRSRRSLSSLKIASRVLVSQISSRDSAFMNRLVRSRQALRVAPGTRLTKRVGAQPLGGIAREEHERIGVVGHRRRAAPDRCALGVDCAPRRELGPELLVLRDDHGPVVDGDRAAPRARAHLFAQLGARDQRLEGARHRRHLHGCELTGMSDVMIVVVDLRADDAAPDPLRIRRERASSEPEIPPRRGADRRGSRSNPRSRWGDPPPSPRRASARRSPGCCPRGRRRRRPRARRRAESRDCVRPR